MPSNSPINTTKIELTDLNNYRNNLSTDSTHPSITNFLMLSSELRTEGLNSLNDSLNSGVSIDEIRGQYSRNLLKDLESLAKRADFQRVAERKNVPKFKQEFYEELKKPAVERSEEYKNFITSCSNFMPNIGDKNLLTCTELISARMLISLDQKEISIEDLKTNLTKDLTDYKEKSKDQTTKDIGSVKTIDNRQELEVAREEIFFKDAQGNTKILNKENFRAETSLTGEQQDFIFSMWQQGTFGSGWFMDAGEKFQEQLMNNNGMVDLNGDKDFLIIDVSKNGKVKIRSRLAVNIIPDILKCDEKIDYTQGVLEVDISDLKNDKFTPGCSTAEPKINFYISEFSKDYKYEIPKGLKMTQSLEYDDIRKQMMEDKKQACIDEITNNREGVNKALDSLSRLTGLDKETLADNKILEGLKKVKISEIENTPSDAKTEILLVRCYKEANTDAEELREFAKQQLLKYCDKQDIKFLDSKETARIKTGIVAILDPVIDDPKEKKHLNNSIEGAIRACAKEKNVAMSFKEKLKNIVEAIFKAYAIKSTINKIQDVKLIGKPPGSSKAQDILKQREESTGTVKTR